jgi:hypothetical protein
MEAQSETLDSAILPENDEEIESAHFPRNTRNKVDPSTMSSSYVLLLDFNQGLLFKVSKIENRACYCEIL